MIAFLNYTGDTKCFFQSLRSQAILLTGQNFGHLAQNFSILLSISHPFISVTITFFYFLTTHDL